MRAHRSLSRLLRIMVEPGGRASTQGGTERFERSGHWTNSWPWSLSVGARSRPPAGIPTAQIRPSGSGSRVVCLEARRISQSPRF
jgi:hypothetical protein